jgi:hypothetical protein
MQYSQAQDPIRDMERSREGGDRKPGQIEMQSISCIICGRRKGIFKEGNPKDVSGPSISRSPPL